MTIGPTNKLIQNLRGAALRHAGAELTDGQLLCCFVERRDEAAFAALVRRHGPMVWGVCRRLLSHHDAEDAFQATFLALSRKADSVRPAERVASWLYGVARQATLQARRAAARREARETPMAEVPDNPVADVLPDDLRAVLDEELSRLPDRFRAVIVLCDLEGKSRSEAARQLGLPEGTVAGWLARARVMLAGRLARRGVSVSGAALAAVLSQGAAPASVVAAAASGLIPARVAALTEGVLKAMLLPKLKVMTLALFVAALACLGVGLLAQTTPADPKRPKEAVGEKGKEKEGIGALAGRWKPVSIEGVMGNSPETLKVTKIDPKGFKGLTMTFDAERIVRKGEGTYKVTYDQEKRPHRLTIHTRTHRLRFIYEVKGDTLRLCCFCLGEQDGVEVVKWPSKFSTDEDRLLFPRLEVWRRVGEADPP
jgi:RNA polymerase sigma factor (sigma-70 family)